MLGKVPSLKADTVCLDLEDGVASTAKAAARANLVEFLKTIQPISPSNQRPELAVRINAFGSGEELQDLHTLLPPTATTAPDCIVLPKLEHPDQLITLQNFLSAPHIAAIEAQRSYPIALIVMIESPNALLSMPELLAPACDRPIPGLAERVQGAIFGGDDFAASAGMMSAVINCKVIVSQIFAVAPIRHMNLPLRAPCLCFNAEALPHAVFNLSLKPISSDC